MFLRELYEAPSKTAVLAFGRLNPPTVGHAKLVDKITSIDGDHYLFLSQTQKPKTDPLDFATKVKFAKQFFPGINVGHQSVRTPVQALEMLQGLGYTDVVFIAGSDRVDGFQKLFDTYNGKEDKSGNIPFKFNSIRVVSAGERDPDADDVSGMSASKMRAAAAAGDLETFAQGVPDAKLAKTMFDAVRKGMGVTEPVEEDIDQRKAEEIIKNAIQHLLNRIDDKKITPDQAHKTLDDDLDGMIEDGYKLASDPKFRDFAHKMLEEFTQRMMARDESVKEGSPISDLKKIISSKVYKQEYLMALKMMKDESISAANAARRFMHVDARTLDSMAVKMGVAEDASPDEEDEFHRKLDKLVHKTFGHSSDEKKKKKKHG